MLTYLPQLSYGYYFQLQFSSFMFVYLYWQSKSLIKYAVGLYFTHSANVYLYIRDSNLLILKYILIEIQNFYFIVYFLVQCKYIIPSYISDFSKWIFYSGMIQFFLFFSLYILYTFVYVCHGAYILFINICSYFYAHVCNFYHTLHYKDL